MTKDFSQTSREELVGRARDLIPVMRERAADTEKARKLLDETIKDFHDTGLMRMHQPKRVGGAETHFTTLLETCATIAEGCASSSWNLINLACHHWMLAMYPPRAQDDVWGISPDQLIGSSVVFPAGRAKKVKGGYELSGRWPFSSAIDCSDWLMLGGIVPDDGTPQGDWRVFLVPTSECEVIDTWHVMGLSGTGSKDVAGEGLFVPEHRTLSIHDVKGGPTPGGEVNPAPLYKIPMMGIFPYLLCPTALGNAQGAYNGFVETTKARIASYNASKIAEHQSMQIKVGKAGALADTAGLIFKSGYDEAMETAVAGKAPDLKRKLELRRDCAFGVGLCTEAIDTLFGASGGGGLYQRNPMERMFRDAHAIQAHIAFSFDVAGGAAGKYALGLGSDNPML